MRRGDGVTGRRGDGARSGATVVEFALVAPLVFLLIFGFMESARVFSAWLVLNNEAREGARIAAVANGQVADPGDFACSWVLERTQDLLKSEYLSCESAAVLDSGGNVADLTLTLRYSIQLVIPIAKPIFGSEFVPMAARSSMRPE